MAITYALATLAGCAEDAAPAARRANPPLPELAPCGPAGDAKLGVVELQLWRGAGVSETEARALGEDARRVWSRLGVDLTIRAYVKSSALKTAFPDGDDPLREVRALLAGLEASDRVHVFALQEVVHPASRLRRTLGEVHGLTLRDDDPLPGLEVSRFPPTLFVEVTELRTPRPGARRFTAAHELGHALGLAHVADRKNLMQTGWFTCLPGLTPEQSDTVGKLLRRPTQ